MVSYILRSIVLALNLAAPSLSLSVWLSLVSLCLSPSRWRWENRMRDNHRRVLGMRTEGRHCRRPAACDGANYNWVRLVHLVGLGAVSDSARKEADRRFRCIVGSTRTQGVDCLYPAAPDPEWVWLNLGLLPDDYNMHILTSRLRAEEEDLGKIFIVGGWLYIGGKDRLGRCWYRAAFLSSCVTLDYIFKCGT